MDKEDKSILGDHYILVAAKDITLKEQANEGHTKYWQSQKKNQTLLQT